MIKFKLPEVEVKSSLKADLKADMCVKAIVEQFKSVGKLDTYKDDLKIIELILNYVENALTKLPKEKKVLICLEVYQQLFGELSVDDKARLTKSINFIIESDLVHVVSLGCKMKRFFKRMKPEL